MRKSGKAILIGVAAAASHACFMAAGLSAGKSSFGWKTEARIRPSNRPWLRQKKGRGAQ